MTPAQLRLARLDDLGAHLSTRDDAVALLGVGSVGVETNRLDEHSDLDFFVIVDSVAAKAAYLADLGWLAAPHPVGFSFQNTVDGYKALYADGIFVECAVFTLDELASIFFERHRVVWQRPGVLLPAGRQPERPPQDTVDFHLNEALTNLFVGLHRDIRGERLTATRFIQQYAVDRLLSVRKLTEAGWAGDGFDITRRVEQHYPDLPLAAMMPGYDGTAKRPESILEWLGERFELDPVMSAAVRDLLA